MRALTALAAVALMTGGVGCGDENGDNADEPTTPAPATVEQTTPKASDSGTTGQVPKSALNTMKAESTRAAKGLKGVSDMDMLPSEKGAQLLVDRQLIDEDKFCAADKAALKVEAGPEVEAAFESGWDSGASDELKGMGSAMYNALSIRCSRPDGGRPRNHPG